MKEAPLHSSWNLLQNKIHHAFSYNFSIPHVIPQLMSNSASANSTAMNCRKAATYDGFTMLPSIPYKFTWLFFMQVGCSLLFYKIRNMVLSFENQQ
jgi:hypothetical protein